MTVFGYSNQTITGSLQGKSFDFNEMASKAYSRELKIITQAHSKLNTLIHLLQKEHREKPHLEADKILLSFDAPHMLAKIKKTQHLRLNAGNIKKEFEFFLNGGFITERAVLETLSLLESAKAQKLHVIFNEGMDTKEGNSVQQLTVVTNKNEKNPDLDQVTSDFGSGTEVIQREFSEEYKRAISDLLTHDTFDIKDKKLFHGDKPQKKTQERPLSKVAVKEKTAAKIKTKKAHQTEHQEKEIEEADKKRRKDKRMKKEEVEVEKIIKSEEKHAEKLERIKVDSKKAKP